MLLARLYPYDPIADMAGQGVLLRISDADLRTILESLEQSSTGRLQVRLMTAQEAGEPLVVQLDWQPEVAGFFCTLAGDSAGVLTYDELAGAIGKQLPQDYRTCRVCLSAELDTWRCGVVDVQRGLVQVYTQREGLATHGARAYLTEANKSLGQDGLCFDLTAGEPVERALRVPYYALRALQGGVEPVYDDETDASAREAFGLLSEVSSSVSEFQRNVRSGGPKPG